MNTDNNKEENTLTLLQSPWNQIKQTFPSFEKVERLASQLPFHLNSTPYFSWVFKKTTPPETNFEERDFLSRMPQDILLLVFNYLEFIDIRNLSIVSRLYYRLSSHDLIWKKIYQKTCQDEIKKVKYESEARSCLFPLKHGQVEAAKELEKEIKDGRRTSNYGNWKELYFAQGFSEKERMKVRKVKVQQFKKNVGWVFQAKSAWGLVLTGILLVLKLDGWISMPWLQLFLPSIVPLFFTSAAILLSLYAEFKFPAVGISARQKKENIEEIIAIAWFLFLIVLQALALVLRLGFKAITWTLVTIPLLLVICSTACWIVWKQVRADPSVFAPTVIGYSMAITYVICMNYVSMHYDYIEDYNIFASVIGAWFLAILSTGFLPQMQMRELLVGVWFVSACVGYLCTFLWFLSAKLDGWTVFSAALLNYWQVLIPLWLLDLTFLTVCLFIIFAPPPLKHHWNLSQRDSKISWWLLCFILLPFVLYQVWCVYRIENNLPSHAALMFVIFSPIFLILGSAATLCVR